jgi:hypothetical protein
MTYSILTSSKQLQSALEVIALIGLLAALLVPRLGAHWFRSVETMGQKLTGHRWRAILLAAAVPMIVRLAMLPIFPTPLPYVHDEFSYLLMADTFAHGRITNPPPPQPQHFEAEYILLHPTYASQYQPGQGLVMAAGQIIAKNPWWGVWASIGLVCGTICWALSYLFPLRWALCGALGAALQFGIFGFWMNSYFGGAVAATGGTLIAGGLLRMRSLPRSSAVICGIGLVVLFASRPLEGAIWAGIAAMWVAANYGRAFLRRVLPAAAVCAIGLMGLAYYNYRVTDRPLQPPYAEGRALYGTPQSFWWQPAVIVTSFDNPQLKDNYLNQLAFWNRRYSLSSLWDSTWRRSRDFWRFFVGPFFTPALFFIWFLRRDRRIRPWLLASIPFIFEHATYHAWYPQHSAAETPLIVIILLQSWRHLRLWRRDRGWGPAMSRNLVAGFCLAILLVSAGHAADSLIPTRFAHVKTIWGSLVPNPRTRDRAVATLERIPGKHLVFVYYDAQHPYTDEWVFNKAEIPGAKIVFSRVIDAKADSALISAMKGYDVWIADVDTGLLSELQDSRSNSSGLYLATAIEDRQRRWTVNVGDQDAQPRVLSPIRSARNVGIPQGDEIVSNHDNDAPIVRTALQH